MGWDNDRWDEIAAAQAAADQLDAERRDRRLRVVPDQPSEPVPDTPRATETAPPTIERIEAPSEAAPTLPAPVPDRRKVDLIAGIRLYAKALRDHVLEDHTDG